MWKSDRKELKRVENEILEIEGIESTKITTKIVCDADDTDTSSIVSEEAGNYHTACFQMLVTFLR